MRILPIFKWIQWISLILIVQIRTAGAGPEPAEPARKYLTPQLLRQFHAADLSAGHEGHVIRITILRALDKPVMISWMMQEPRDQVVIRTLSGQTGQAGSKLQSLKTIEITPGESEALLAMLGEARLETMQQPDWGSDSLDGSTWIWEIAAEGDYKSYVRTNPFSTFRPMPDGRPDSEEICRVRSFLNIPLMIWLKAGLAKETIY